MSVQATAAVLYSSLKARAKQAGVKYGPTLKLVAWAIADRCGPDGEAFMAIPAATLARVTEVSIRSVRKALGDLEKMGVIELSTINEKGVSSWSMPLEGRVRLGGCRCVYCEGTEGGCNRCRGVQSSHSGGATVAGQGVQPLHPIPVRTPEEPDTPLPPAVKAKRKTRKPVEFPEDLVKAWPDLPSLWEDRMTDNKLRPKVSEKAEQKQLNDLARFAAVKGIPLARQALELSTTANNHTVIYPSTWNMKLIQRPEANATSPLAEAARRQQRGGGG